MLRWIGDHDKLRTFSFKAFSIVGGRCHNSKVAAAKFCCCKVYACDCKHSSAAASVHFAATTLPVRRQKQTAITGPLVFVGSAKLVANWQPQILAVPSKPQVCSSASVAVKTGCSSVALRLISSHCKVDFVAAKFTSSLQSSLCCCKVASCSCSCKSKVVIA